MQDNKIKKAIKLLEALTNRKISLKENISLQDGKLEITVKTEDNIYDHGKPGLDLERVVFSELYRNFNYEIVPIVLNDKSEINIYVTEIEVLDFNRFCCIIDFNSSKETYDIMISDGAIWNNKEGFDDIDANFYGLYKNNFNEDLSKMVNYIKPFLIENIETLLEM